MITWWHDDAVNLTAQPDLEGPLGELFRSARSAAHPEPLNARLALARRLGEDAPQPEQDPLHLWSVLATLGAADLGVARTAESHLDALSILGQARRAGVAEIDPEGDWGVYAAEGPGGKLEGRPAPVGEAATGTWLLDGPKPWCSLGDEVDHALVTAHTAAGRRLFAVDLRQAGVEPARTPWAGRGLVEVPSAGLTFHHVSARPIGEAGWYLERPGFAWGGIGVAAVWFGGAVGVARTLVRVAARREPDQVASMHLGAIDQQIQAAASLLADAAAQIRSGEVGSPGGPRRLALLCRTQVARVAEEVLVRVGHGTGPAPLTGDGSHAKRVADLTVYLRQDHAERDLAALGELLAADLSTTERDASGRSSR